MSKVPSSKRFTGLVAALITAVLLSACASSKPAQKSNSDSNANANANANKSQNAGKQLHFVMLTHDGGTTFFAPVRAGFLDACAQVGAKCEFLGPPTFDVNAERNMLESSLQSGIDGIATTVPDPKAFNDVIAKARAKGIPVVGYNTVPDNNPTQSYIGQGMLEAGRKLGNGVAKLLGGKGKAVIFTCCPGHPALEGRIQGTKEALEKAGVQVVNVVNYTADASKAYEIIGNTLAANPDLNAIMGVDAYTETIGRYIQDKKLQDKIVGAGFDYTDGTLKAIQSGALKFTVGQNPYLQGYLPVLQLFLAVKKGTAPIDIDTKVDIVSKENVDQYIAQIADQTQGYKSQFNGAK